MKNFKRLVKDNQSKHSGFGSSFLKWLSRIKKRAGNNQKQTRPEYIDPPVYDTYPLPNPHPFWEKATNMHELTELINQNLKPASLQTGTEVKIITVKATTMKELLKDKFLIILFVAIILALLFGACTSTRDNSMGARDMPVSHHYFSSFGGLHDAGIYIVTSEKYGLFFLKVRKFYRQGDSRFIVWQPQPGMETDKVSYFGSMEWLREDSAQIFKIQYDRKGEPLPAY